MDPITHPDDFPASRNSTYLNAASVSLMYQGASDSAIEWQQDLTQFGTMHFDEKAEDAVFENLRVAGAKLFNADADDIAVGSSATELIASLAWAVAPGKGNNIVATNVVFPSTIFPWSRVARLTGAEVRWARGQTGYVRPEDIIDLIDKNTAVVCLSHVEYGTGQRYDLARFAEAAHAVGALLIVDATQSAGMLPIDVQEAQADALISGAYKWLCGPFGVAVMYLAPDLYGKLDPGLVGWRSHRDIWNLKADRLELPDTARRFEFSTMAYGCAIGLQRSIEYLMRIGIPEIFHYTRALADILRQALEDRGAEIVSPVGDEERTAILSVRFPGKDSAQIAEALTANGVILSLRGDFVRFSPHLYNSSADIERTIELIDRIL